MEEHARLAHCWEQDDVWRLGTLIGLSIIRCWIERQTSWAVLLEGTSTYLPHGNQLDWSLYLSYRQYLSFQCWHYLPLHFRYKKHMSFVSCMDFLLLSGLSIQFTVDRRQRPSSKTSSSSIIIIERLYRFVSIIIIINY